MPARRSSWGDGGQSRHAAGHGDLRGDPRPPLASGSRGATLTRVVGLGAACVTAAAVAALLDRAGDLPPGFVVDEAAPAGLAAVTPAAVGRALAAGVVGMLALETRGGAAVGVAISVTTSPAAAYLGV